MSCMEMSLSAYLARAVDHFVFGSCCTCLENMYVRQGFSFWNRCAVEQLRTVSSRFVSHFLAQNGEGTARSWKNPMHQTKT